jgi:DNA-binding transcriptional MerR regulator
MIRYYEQIKLISPAHRAQSSYRTYSENDIHTLQFIRGARDLGFSVEQMKTLLARWRDRSRGQRRCEGRRPRAYRRIGAQGGGHCRHDKDIETPRQHLPGKRPPGLSDHRGNCQRAGRQYDRWSGSFRRLQPALAVVQDLPAVARRRAYRGQHSWSQPHSVRPYVFEQCKTLASG